VRIPDCRQVLRFLKGLAVVLAAATASKSLAHESPLSEADARLAATMILFGAESLDAEDTQRASEVLGKLRSWPTMIESPFELTDVLEVSWTLLEPSDDQRVAFRSSLEQSLRPAMTVYEDRIRDALATGLQVVASIRGGDPNAADLANKMTAADASAGRAAETLANEVSLRFLELEELCTARQTDRLAVVAAYARQQARLATLTFTLPLARWNPVDAALRAISESGRDPTALGAVLHQLVQRPIMEREAVVDAAVSAFRTRQRASWSLQVRGMVERQAGRRPRVSEAFTLLRPALRDSANAQFDLARLNLEIASRIVGIAGYDGRRLADELVVGGMPDLASVLPWTSHRVKTIVRMGETECSTPAREALDERIEPLLQRVADARDDLVVQMLDEHRRFLGRMSIDADTSAAMRDRLGRRAEEVLDAELELAAAIRAWLDDGRTCEWPRLRAQIAEIEARSEDRSAITAASWVTRLR